MIKWIIVAAILGTLVWAIYMMQPHLRWPPTITQLSYTNGQEVARRVLNFNDRTYVNLRSNVSKTSVWTWDINTYVPRELFIGDGLLINCVGNSIVLSTTNGRRQVQYSTLVGSGCTRLKPD